MWDRWKEGDTLHEIGNLFDRPRTSIHTILSATCGIRPPTGIDLPYLERCLRENKSPEHWLLVNRFAASRLRQATATIVASCYTMTTELNTERLRPMLQRGSVLVDPRHGNWNATLQAQIVAVKLQGL